MPVTNIQVGDIISNGFVVYKVKEVHDGKAVVVRAIGYYHIKLPQRERWEIQQETSEWRCSGGYPSDTWYDRMTKTKRKIV